MKGIYWFSRLLCIVSLVFFSTTLYADTTFVKFGSNWKYLDVGSAAPTGSGAADWRNIGFSDAGWNDGPAEMGYGNNDERTVVSFGPNASNKYITTYFRHIANIPNASDFGTFRLNIYLDDGAVVYVNGTEVARYNMPGGTPGFSTLASTAATEDGFRINTIDISNAAFINGNNIIAVEVHQNTAGSSDLSFDFELIGKPQTSNFPLISYGSVWKYLDNGSNQGTAWRAKTFNDASWSSGAAQLGYGDGDEATVVSYGGNASNKYITTYFRKSISLDPADYSGFTANFKRDDGCVIYVNGVEVARSNMPTGTINFNTTTSNATDNGNTEQTVTINSSAFANGTNVIAVEMHQTSATSSDLSFDLELIGTPASAGGSVINYGDSWKYLDNGSNQGSAWTGTGFNDNSWSAGNAELGYGDGDEGTVVSYGPSSSNKYVTTYFRKSVTLDPADYGSFSANIKRDDGCIVYVNGTEVFRNNLGASVNYQTYATNATDDGATPQSFSISPSLFVNGSNVIAVEIHQTNASSTDLSFDFELTGAASGIEPEILRGPMLQMVSGSAITIKWTTDAASDSRILYGTDLNNLASSVSNLTQVTDHELRITGLTADTKYYYAIGTTTSILKGSYRTYFVTSPPATTTRKIRIAVFGDAGTGNATQKSTRNGFLRVKKGTNNSDLALMLGDNAYNGGYDNEYQTHFFDIYDENVFDNHAVFSVPGNHEYDNNGPLRSSHSIPYYSVFSLPTAAESGGTPSGTEHYYSFDYGNIHFIMLDSYGSDNGKYLYDSTGDQATWLKADLAAYAHQRKWTIVCLHHPPYTNGTHFSNSESDLTAIRQQITPILERYGVDIVLAGHSHVYERSFLIQGHTGVSSSFVASAPPIGNQVSNSSAKYDGSTNSCPYFTIDSLDKHGTVYVTAGSAGQIGGGTNAQYPAFYYRSYSGTSGGESGALYLEVEDNRIDAKFVGASGAVKDQFTIMKDVKKKQQVTTIVNTATTLNASWIGAYNWSTDPAFSTVIGTSKSYTLTPAATGTYTYYVADSLSPSATCITDTLMLQVNSSLAVSLLGFDVVLKNDAALLQWSTAYEENNDHFTIEKSYNGKDFGFLMAVPAAGNSSITSGYEYTDYYLREGNNYYRLIQTDRDGKSKILGIRVVSYKNNRPFSVSVKPNPAVNQQMVASIQSSKKQTLQVRVFDMNGIEVHKMHLKTEPGSQTISFHLKPGTYVMNVQSGDGDQIKEKVIVK